VIFGDAAARWAGLAALNLGWRPPEFWSATPAELLSIVGLWLEQAGGAAPAMDPAELARLKEIFPDE
jgi:hypothetical protein